jgi:hypothetical protein
VSELSHTLYSIGPHRGSAGYHAELLRITHGPLPHGRMLPCDTYDCESRPLCEIKARSLHEALPGHLLLIAFHQELDLHRGSVDYYVREENHDNQ